MDEGQKAESDQIKVNRLSIDKEKYIPYSKYIKNDYPQLSKVVPKHSILYKVKYKPEMKLNEINQYFFKSNENKKNINIKDNTMNKINDSYNHNMRLYNELKNNYNSSDYTNYYNKENNLTEVSKNTVDYIEINDEGIYDNGKRLTNYIPSKQKNLTQNNSEKINIINNNIYKDKNLDNSHSYLFNKFTNNKFDMNQKDINNKKVKKRNTFYTSKYDKYRHKNLSLGFFDIYNKMNGEASETSVESINNKVNQNPNQDNKIIVFSGKKIKNYIDRINIENKSYNENNINNNLNKDDSISKMEIYRVKLFNEFFKHFQKFYKNFIKKYYIYFFKEIINFEKQKKINNSKNIENYYSKKKK